MRAARRAQRGFTLVELMVSLVIFSLVMAGSLAVAVSMSQGFREQRSAVATEASVRVPLDFIADVLRQASPAVADPTQIQDASTCATGALVVTNNAGGAGPDKLDVIYASGGVVTTAQTAVVAGTSTVTVTDASLLAAGDSVLISNLSAGHLFKVASVSGNVLTLGSTCGALALPTGGYPAGSIVVRAQHATFYVGTQDGVPTLFMDPDSDANPAQVAEPFAEGIEDLQVALGVDAGTDGVTEAGSAANDDEWQGNAAGDTALAGTLRAVRVTLVGRAGQPLRGPVTAYARPAVEDHAAATTADAYRRRVLRTIVEIRNVGVSP